MLPIVLVVAAACGGEPSGSEPAPPVPATSTGGPTAAPSEPPAEQPPAAPRTGELTSGPLKHTVRTDTLTVDIVYTPAKPVKEWTADSTKPLQVRVTLHDRRQPRQKIYLTRATMRFTLDDGTNDVPGPEPLVDAANIAPGFLTTSPNNYIQSFAVPPIDPSARHITIDLKLELVSLVDARASDYAKQAVTDTVTATPAF